MSNKRDFLDKVRRFADSHGLFSENGTYLVGLSGGADSVSLLLVMLDMGVHVEAVHCNFKLRGEESFRDEQFCVDLCGRLGVPLHKVHFDTAEYAKLHKISIEMAARDLRYAYFENLRNDLNACGICVAHHRDDSVETAIMNMLRGTGIRGLQGIVAHNGFIMRPLLCVGRDEILQYLESKGQSYVTDSTNLVDDVTRNKIRLKVVPLLKEINPNALNSIFQTTQHVGEALKIVYSSLDAAKEKVMPDGSTIDISLLIKQPSPEYLLFHVLNGCGFSSVVVKEIYSAVLRGASGKVWTSNSHEALIDRGRIVVEEKQTEEMRVLKVPEPGTYIYNSQVKFSFVSENYTDGYNVNCGKDCVCVDMQSVKFPLTIRPVAKGDRFVPFGMKSQKLVSDFLTDRKYTLFDKRRQLAVVDADSNIVWLVGERIDNRCRLTSDSRVVLKLSRL